jgi:hypothetical protein
MKGVSLRGRIDELLELPGDELQGPYAAELEDTVQRGLAAVHSAELWVLHVQRALEGAGDDPERAAALERELAASRTVVEEARKRVGPLHRRAQELGVGTPRATV